MSVIDFLCIFLFYYFDGQYTAIFFLFQKSHSFRLITKESIIMMFMLGSSRSKAKNLEQKSLKPNDFRFESPHKFPCFFLRKSYGWKAHFLCPSPPFLFFAFVCCNRFFHSFCFFFTLLLPHNSVLSVLC